MRSIILGDGNTVEPLTTLFGQGYAVRSARKHVAGRIEYRHAVETWLLHVTLAGALARFTGRFGARDPHVTVSRPGLVGFTPPGWDRHGTLEGGDVVAVEIELDRSLVETACEQRVDAERHGGFFNLPDPKTTELVSALVDRPEASTADVEADLLAHALARHVGKRMAGAECRRDDGWLHPAALRRVIERVEGDLCAPPSLHELSQLAGLGPSAFIRAFRGSTGRTPAAFAMERRLAHVRTALRTSDLSLATIAVEFGFSSKAHLIAAFRHHYGTTPGSVRAARL